METRTDTTVTTTSTEHYRLPWLLHRTPPFLAFALARNGRSHRPTFGELVSASGLSQTTFLRISRRLSWDNVKVADMIAFCRACNIDILAMSKQRTFFRQTVRYKGQFSHLTRQQLQKFKRQLATWQQAEHDPSH